MVSQQVEQPETMAGISHEVIFAGDHVRLAGQIDYPGTPTPATGYPLIFILQHATCTSRKGYVHYVPLAHAAGAAIFLWDKRGTGRSGSGGYGSPNEDALKAYEAALSQPDIDRNRVIILAQNEASLMLAEIYQQLSMISPPAGVILAGNMLDETGILNIKAPLHIVTSKNDWNDWHIYADAASLAHRARYKLPVSYYVAPNSNRRLFYTNGGSFHKGAAVSITQWLQHQCKPKN